MNKRSSQIKKNSGRKLQTTGCKFSSGMLPFHSDVGTLQKHNDFTEMPLRRGVKFRAYAKSFISEENF